MIDEIKIFSVHVEKITRGVPVLVCYCYCSNLCQLVN